MAIQAPEWGLSDCFSGGWKRSLQPFRLPLIRLRRFSLAFRPIIGNNAHAQIFE